MKRCWKCHHDKPHADFYSNASKPDGLSEMCRPCWKAYQTNRRRHAELDGLRRAFVDTVSARVMRHLFGSAS
jgi:hypothetical protein